MLQTRYQLILFPLVPLLLCMFSQAQTAAEMNQAIPRELSANTAERSTEHKLVLNIVDDQKAFWTAPARVRADDVKWLVPFVGTSALLIGSDKSIERKLPSSPTVIKRSQDFSNFGVASLVGTAGSLYVWGHFTHDDHRRETGFLSGEAFANSFLTTSLIKVAAGRDRPLQGNGQGQFWTGGNSFPSEHAAAAWSVASVIAHEYPGPLTKLLAYGTASAISASRVTGRQHFTSDVFIGSALGWYVGRQVYRAHHDPELGGVESATFEVSEKESRPENMGSPYVSLDSWVYPAFDRLISFGYVQTAYLGIRPWTRMECARLLQEAAEYMQRDGPGESEANKLYTALDKEFVDESARLNGAQNLGMSVDSIYGRTTNISGRPLRDGYHFGQTITNDFSRPYGPGFNAIGGLTVHAVAGPLAFYVREEYQHSPGLPSDPSNVQQAIAAADLTLPVSNALPQVSRLQLVEGTVALNLNNFQISFGKQSLWLGPGQAGPLLFSDNAEPIVMLKIDSVTPRTIPLLSRVLGPARSEFFLGQLDGHQFEFNGVTNSLLGPGNINPQPYLHGYKVSFKPTPNLEFGMGITAQFAGPGLPFTWKNFLRTFFSHTSGTNNPGKRLSAFDFSYRIPHLRKWLMFYNDSLVVDEISPVGSTRPMLNPGIYMPQIPKLPKLDFRAEGLHESLTDEFAPGYIYYGQRRFRSGYTNGGTLLGSWIGRAGRGGQAWMTCWFSPRNKFQLGYRHQEVSKDFIGGGRLVDYSARGDLILSSSVAFSGFLQYEQWKFPVLLPGRQSNLTASFQFTFHPHWRIGN